MKPKLNIVQAFQPDIGNAFVGLYIQFFWILIREIRISQFNQNYICTLHDSVTCNDGIENGDETGVDCGGSCEACKGMYFQAY